MLITVDGINTLGDVSTFFLRRAFMLPALSLKNIHFFSHLNKLKPYYVLVTQVLFFILELFTFFTLRLLILKQTTPFIRVSLIIPFVSSPILVENSICDR